MDQLTASIPHFPHTDEILSSPFEVSDGTTVIPEIGGTGAATRTMVRELGIDICDLPIINYLSAREHGAAMTAIPVFPKRSYVQGMIFCNRETGVVTPKDLEGKRVGISYHGNTDALWVRGVLQESYGVDCDRITWVTAIDEQIPGAVLPENVEPSQGSALNDLLAQGEIAAMVGGRGFKVGGPIELLLPDVEAAEKEWYAKTEIFPIFHIMVVKDSVLATHPHLARDLVDAFTTSKARAFERLAAGAELTPEEIEEAKTSGFPTSMGPSAPLAYLGPDPLTYGVEPNRANIEMLTRFAQEQRVIYRNFTVDELFAPIED